MLITDDRAIIDQYQYAQTMFYTSKGKFLKKKGKNLGGTMIATNAGKNTGIDLS